METSRTTSKYLLLRTCLILNWRNVIILLTPLVLSPLIFFNNSQESRCGFVICLMGIYWVTEVVPMAVTALIPVFAFPLLGVLKTDDICFVYMTQTNMLFVGGLMVAIAVEYSNLHKRIALSIILFMGQGPFQLMTSFMMTTMFSSMWISNTASTAMMIPIVDAILQEFYKIFGREIAEGESMACIKDTDENDTFRDSSPTQSESGSRTSRYFNKNLETVENEFQFDEGSAIEVSGRIVTPPNETCKSLRDMFFLATAYGANLGGTGSIMGTTTNLVLKGMLSSLYTEQTELNFASWMMFCVPCMIACGILVLAWLYYFFLGFGKNIFTDVSEKKKYEIKKIIQRKYDALGSFTFHEGTVAISFITLILLWLFLSPGFITGWGSGIKYLFGDQAEVQDATPVMLIVFILFAIPARPNQGVSKKSKESPGCLTWKQIHEKLPWEIVLLMGGGFAIAKATNESGLSVWLGDKFRYFDYLSPTVIMFIVCILSAMATELTSNTATASILLPILNDLAVSLCINPLYLMLPVTLCCSYAFMLPVATPPNALVFGAANMKSSVMAKAGFVPNLMCVMVVTMMVMAIGNPILGLHEIPSWINSSVTKQITSCG